MRNPKLDESDLALCRSILYEALALGFRPPTDETVSRLASEAGVSALADAASVLDEAQGTELARLIRRTLAPRVSPARLHSLAGLQTSFRRLFGHTARAGVPPYETEYGGDSLFQPPQEMSDLAGFYRAFGLVLQPSEHERIDHISCECEFLLFLARKEAYAFVRDEAASLEETHRADRFFLRHHLGQWGPAFGRRLAREDRGGFYAALGGLLEAFVTSECVRVGAPQGPEFLRLRSTSPGEAPMACGRADDLLQIESPMSAGSPERTRRGQ
ncbi:MAG: molecular chaperone TorD family protein [candidate division NC10 bacterium]|nr:molecular chaperone TorD family protein [candidate division NC10 bacterium]